MAAAAEPEVYPCHRGVVPLSKKYIQAERASNQYVLPRERDKYLRDGKSRGGTRCTLRTVIYRYCSASETSVHTVPPSEATNTVTAQQSTS